MSTHPNTPLSEYELILKSCIDKKYEHSREIILNGLKNRIELFSQYVNSLKNNLEEPFSSEDDNLDYFSENKQTFFVKRKEKTELANTSNKKLKAENNELKPESNIALPKIENWGLIPNNNY